MELKFIIESILFSAQQPLSPKDLRELLATAAEQSEVAGVKAFKKTSLDDIIAVLVDLEQEHDAAKRSYRLACVAGLWQFASNRARAALKGRAPVAIPITVQRTARSASNLIATIVAWVILVGAAAIILGECKPYEPPPCYDQCD